MSELPPSAESVNCHQNEWRSCKRMYSSSEKVLASHRNVFVMHLPETQYGETVPISKQTKRGNGNWRIQRSFKKNEGTLEIMQVQFKLFVTYISRMITSWNFKAHNQVKLHTPNTVTVYHHINTHLNLAPFFNSITSNIAHVFISWHCNARSVQSEWNLSRVMI